MSDVNNKTPENDAEENELTVGKLIEMLKEYPANMPVLMVIPTPKDDDDDAVANENEATNKKADPNNPEEEEEDAMYLPIDYLEEIDQEDENGNKTTALGLVYTPEDEDDDDDGDNVEEPVDNSPSGE